MPDRVAGSRQSAAEPVDLSYLPVMQQPVRTALYLDFDNVFGGLLKLDPTLAQQFAEKPGVWVERLATSLLNGGERRWLVLRCYMNPGGSVTLTGGGPRLVFASFRRAFTVAGFEVVDCPRLAQAKNGADIRIALDAAEALVADVRYEEFVIASGDSDMTPLLVRLRAADRWTTVLSPSDSAVVLGAIADRLIGGEELLELLLDEGAGPADAMLDAGEAGDASTEVAARFQGLVRQRYDGATAALNLAGLGQQLRADLGPAASTDGWAGHRSLKRALQGLDLPGARISTHFLWDSRRHDPPEEAQPTVAPGETPAPVARVTSELRLPRLDRSAWHPIHEALAAHVAAHEFNLAETTRWARDRLVERGVEVGRGSVNVVARGAAYGGCPLYREPAPSAAEIGEAFVANVVDRARAAEVDLDEREVAVVREWFGAPTT